MLALKNRQLTQLGRQQRGFTIIEQLTALIILSVGLLGMASLQLSASKLERHGMYYARALNYANSIAEVIMSNPEGARGGDYILGVDDTLDPLPGCDVGFCESDDLAVYEKFTWKSELSDSAANGGLPNAEASISANNVGLTEFTILITWDEPDGAHNVTLVVGI